MRNSFHSSSDNNAINKCWVSSRMKFVHYDLGNSIHNILFSPVLFLSSPPKNIASDIAWCKTGSRIFELNLIKSEWIAKIPNVLKNVMDFKHVHSRHIIYNFSEKCSTVSAHFQLMLNRFLSICWRENALWQTNFCSLFTVPAFSTR